MQTRIVIVRDGSRTYQRVSRGIRRFALNRPDWKVGDVVARQTSSRELRDMLKWEPHGILVLCRYAEADSFFGFGGIPSILVDLHHERPPGVSRVEPGNHQAGRMAAEFFVQKQYKHLAIVNRPTPSKPSDFREEGFLEYLEERDLSAHRFLLDHLGEKPWYPNGKLEAWLNNLPKPVGIYCVQDKAGRRLLDHCERLGLRVPMEVGVLGTGNNSSSCTTSRPYMSSIGMREEQIGYRAAEGLIQQIDALARGEDPPVFHDIIPPHAVEERQTTSLKMIADPAIAKAVNYLMDHALTGATITDAARASGVNRRTMERGFKRHLGITPNAYVLDLKIAHAKNLLESTDLPLRNIAEACRFSQEHFTRFFQQQTGLTPSAYRKRNTLPRCL